LAHCPKDNHLPINMLRKATERLNEAQTIISNQLASLFEIFEISVGECPQTPSTQLEASATLHMDRVAVYCRQKSGMVHYIVHLYAGRQSVLDMIPE
jgi:hypothetical protein